MYEEDECGKETKLNFEICYSVFDVYCGVAILDLIQPFV